MRKIHIGNQVLAYEERKLKYSDMTLFTKKTFRETFRKSSEFISTLNAIKQDKISFLFASGEADNLISKLKDLYGAENILVLANDSDFSWGHTLARATSNLNKEDSQLISGTRTYKFFDIQKLLASIGLTSTQFLIACILCGCDYNKQVICIIIIVAINL